MSDTTSKNTTMRIMGGVVAVDKNYWVGGPAVIGGLPRRKALRKYILGVPMSMRTDILLEEYAKLERKMIKLLTAAGRKENNIC